MKSFWKVRSGEFAGWRRDNILCDVDGRNVGYFRGDMAYNLRGRYIGEIYRDDWIGTRKGIVRSIGGAGAICAGIAAAKYANRAGLAIAGWEDPDF